MRLGQNKNKKKEEKKKGNGFPVGLLFAALVLCGGVAYFVFQTSESEVSSSQEEFTGMLITKEELTKYDGRDITKPIYLAILGEVFDVSSGKYYKPDGNYHFFAGVDASRAYVTGNFKDDLTDNLDGLRPTEIGSIKGWHDFFVESQDYKYVGRVVGRFYDAEGNPTDALGTVEEALEESDQIAAAEEKSKEQFPLCNSAWERETKMTRFWCTQRSGGKQREWAGYPRKVFNPRNKRTRCGCAQDPNDKNPDLAMYEGCNPKSFECFAKKK